MSLSTRIERLEHKPPSPNCDRKFWELFDRVPADDPARIALERVAEQIAIAVYGEGDRRSVAKLMRQARRHVIDAARRNGIDGLIEAVHSWARTDE